VAESYRTLAAPLRHEIDKVKGSRFIADVAPVATRAEAESLVQRIRRELHAARHHCFAWRLEPDGSAFRASDDGEPSGSAGRPILLELEARELTFCIAVVTRYFGGTKLGVGGLVRAYGAAVAQALERACVRTVTLTRRVLVEHPWECSSAVQRLLSTLAQVPARAEYADRVRLELEVPVGMVEEFLRRLREETAGRATARAAE